MRLQPGYISHPGLKAARHGGSFTSEQRTAAPQLLPSTVEGLKSIKKAVFLCSGGDTAESLTVKTKSLAQIISDMAQIKTLHTLWKTQSFPLITAAY